MGFKLAGIIGIVSLLALAAMGVAIKNLQADLKGKDAEILRLADVVTGLNAQNAALQADVADKVRLLHAAEDRAAAQDVAIAALNKEKAHLKNRLDREIDHANTIEDGPAAGVLQYAANSLRRFSADIQALSAGHDHQNGGAGVQGAGDLHDDLPAAAGSWPGTQREFAILAMKFGEYSLACAKDKVAIQRWQVEDAAIAAKANGASP